MEGRDGPGLRGESELALVHGLPSKAHLSMVSSSHAAGCVSTAGEAPAPESKQVSESPPHPGRQLNMRGGGWECWGGAGRDGGRGENCSQDHHSSEPGAVISCSGI